jgi:hypothetical protein
MPGSPPTSSTEPRTKPPPVTRSSSAMPDERRGASWLLPARLSSAKVRPLRFERIDTGMLPAVSSSASVFHSPQDSHLPCQRLYAAPQFWQTKERVVDLAMGGLRSRFGAVAPSNILESHTWQSPEPSRGHHRRNTRLRLTRLAAAAGMMIFRESNCTWEVHERARFGLASRLFMAYSVRRSFSLGRIA